MSKDESPSFLQPYLEITLAGAGAKLLSTEGVMWIDVGGRIDHYITPENKATEALIELCRQIAKAGAVVVSFKRYQGSAGASHILRGGALYRRMNDVEFPPKEVLAYEFREPAYRGP